MRLKVGGMAEATAKYVGDAPASAGDVRLRHELGRIRALLSIRQALTDRLAVIQRDLDESVALVRELEGR